MPFNALFAGGDCELRKSGRARFTFLVHDFARVTELFRGMFVELSVRLGKNDGLCFCLDLPDRDLGSWAIPVQDGARLKLARGRGDCEVRIESETGTVVSLAPFAEGLGHDWSGGVARAVDFLGKGDAESAAALLLPIAARRTAPPSAHHLLGRCHRALGRLPEAISCYREAVRHSAAAGVLKPWAAGPLSDMGVAFKKAGEAGRAVHCFLHALHLRPNQPEALLSFFSLMALDDAYVLFAAARVLALGAGDEMVEEYLESYARITGREQAALLCEARQLAKKVDLLDWPLHRPLFGSLASFERGLVEAATVAPACRWGPGTASA